FCIAHRAFPEGMTHLRRVISPNFRFEPDLVGKPCPLFRVMLGPRCLMLWQRGQAVLGRASRKPKRPLGKRKRKRRMSESAKPRMAVIGLGSMGFGMATSLRRAGFEVTGCDVSADSVARFVADGGKGAKTPAEAAKDADIVV